MKELDVITNIIVANLGNTESNGLVRGKMGICLFLYEYAKYADSKYHEGLADSLLDELYIASQETLPTDIYAGIGIGLSMLLHEGFVSGFADYVLHKLDNLIIGNIEKFTRNDLRYNSTLFSAGLYLVHRLPLCDENKRREWSENLITALKRIDEGKKGTINTYTYSHIKDSFVKVLDAIDGYGLVDSSTVVSLKQKYNEAETTYEELNQYSIMCERMWFDFLHHQVSRYSVSELQEFIINERKNYPYIIDTINSNLSIAGLQLIHNKI